MPDQWVSALPGRSGFSGDLFGLVTQKYSVSSLTAALGWAKNREKTRASKGQSINPITQPLEPVLDAGEAVLDATQ